MLDHRANRRRLPKQSPGWTTWKLLLVLAGAVALIFVAARVLSVW